ncbi:MAG: RagB/SusD family nutrient uptake outer membrane protein [Tannerella sp.]|nr:RagB/SusD family nutrient uptake outer membrane protein [Tannerella sp.]
MKHNFLALTALTVLTMLAACGEDFLYKSPQGSIDQDALTNPQGVELLVVNAYANLTENDWGASIFNWALSGIYGGDANKGSDGGDQSILNSLETYALIPTNSYINEKWIWVYKGAKRVNLTMQIMDQVDGMDASLKQLRRGELLCLRAMFYFEGLRVFGGYIPYVDESFTDNDPKVHNDRDIYPDVLADIDEAIALLPEQPADPARVYKWAALALKAKILMQKGDMAAAKPILADVLAGGHTATGKKYALANNLNDNWSTYMDNTSPESIWEIQFTNDGNDNSNTGMSLCYPHTGGPGGCCGFYQPSYELANSFQVDENGLPYLNGEYRTNGRNVSSVADVTVDPRLDFAAGRVGVPYKDYGPTMSGWIRDANNGGVFLPKKHVYSKAEETDGYGRSSMSLNWSPGSAMNIQYLSVRDAMLMYAECLAADGELAAAMHLVNQIRERAALPVNLIEGSPATCKVSLYPESHAAFTDKATCIKAVRMERKLELAMEGQRFFDLTRWGGDYMAAELGAYVDYEKAYINKFAGASHLPPEKTMFPIPQTQIETMGNDENGQPYLVQPAPWK